MIKCPGCGRTVDSEAQACVFCGRRLAKGTRKTALVVGAAGCFLLVAVAVAVGVVLLVSMRPTGPPKASAVKVYIEAMRPVWEESTSVRRSIPNDLERAERRPKIDALVTNFTSLLLRARAHTPPAECAEVHSIYVEVTAKRVELLQNLKSSTVGSRFAEMAFRSGLQKTDYKMVTFNNELSHVISDHGLVVMKGVYVK